MFQVLKDGDKEVFQAVETVHWQRLEVAALYPPPIAPVNMACRKPLPTGYTPPGACPKPKESGMCAPGTCPWGLRPRNQEHSAVCPGPQLHNCPLLWPQLTKTLCHLLCCLCHLSRQLLSYRRGRPAAAAALSEGQHPVVNSPHSFLTEK